MKKIMYLLFFVCVLLMSTAFAKTELSEITINGIPELIGGNTITTDFSISEQGISVTSVAWDKADEWGIYNISNPETFESGEKYRVYIGLDLDEDVELAEGYTINTPGFVPDEKYAYSDYCYLYVTVPGEKSKIIKSVEIYNVTEPIAGMSQTIQDIQVDSPNINIDTSNTYWLVNGELRKFNDEIFATDTIYGIYVLVEPINGYSFDENITATVNGNTASDIQSRGVNDESRAIIYHFPATSSTPVTQLNSITINGIPELTVGNSISFEGYSIPEDGISVDYVSWDKADEYGTYNITVKDSDKFEEGKYRVCIHYNIDDGYKLKTDYIMIPNQIGTEYYLYKEYCYIYFEISGSKHKVTFNPNNGTPSWVEYVEDEATVSRPDDPSYGYLEFEYWYVGNNIDNTFDFSTAVTEDINLTAAWIFRWTIISSPEEGGKCARPNSQEQYFSSHYEQTGAYYGSHYYYADFKAVPNDGYHFKEWRIGRWDGEVISTTDSSEPCYIDSNNILYVTETINHPSTYFYAIFEKNTSTKGDLDGNNKVEIIDVRLLLQAYINSNSSTEWTTEQLATMDMNDDEKVDILDVRLLLQEYINS